MGQGLDILAVKRVNTIMMELRDRRDLPQPLRWLNRLNEVPATDGELLGRFRGNVYISDIINVNGRAVTKGGQKYTTFQQAIPKIRHGAEIDEEMINLLTRLEENGAGGGFDELTLRGYVANRLDDIDLGIRERKNAIALAMMLDAFDYSRGGVVISGASWGVYADFKSTPTTPWVVAATGLPNASATPITDISVQRQHDLEVFGEVRNRITLSAVVLRGIIGTTEFQAKAQLYSLILFPAASFPLLAELGPQIRLLSTILDDGSGPMEIEVADERYWDLMEDGSEVSMPYLPRNKVILSNSADDNNNRAAYMGQAIVPETQVSSIVDSGEMIGRFTAPQRGPVAWSEGRLNPTAITVWGADKAWPVRRRLGMTSILTVY